MCAWGEGALLLQSSKGNWGTTAKGASGEMRRAGGDQAQGQRSLLGRGRRPAGRSGVWCVLLGLLSTTLVHAAKDGQLPSWHPHRFRVRFTSHPGPGHLLPSHCVAAGIPSSNPKIQQRRLERGLPLAARPDGGRWTVLNYNGIKALAHASPANSLCAECGPAISDASRALREVWFRRLQDKWTSGNASATQMEPSPSRGSAFRATAVGDSGGEEGEAGSWGKCLRCDSGCVTHTDPPVSEANECRPCTGCSHTFYAVNGTISFLDTDYIVRDMASPWFANTRERRRRRPALRVYTRAILPIQPFRAPAGGWSEDAPASRAYVALSLHTYPCARANGVPTCS